MPWVDCQLEMYEMESIAPSVRKKLRALLKPLSLNIWTTPMILIITALAISTVGITSYQIVKNLILKQLQEKALLQIRLGTDEIDQWLARHSSEVQTLANTDIVRSCNWSAMKPYLQAEVKRIGEHHISLSLPNGIYYTTYGASGYNKDRDFIQKALLGQVNVSDPFISRTSDVPLVAISSPIRRNYDTATPPIGVLTGNLQVKLVAQVVNRLHYGSGSYAFALDSRGETIIHPNPAMMSTVDKPRPIFLKSPNPYIAALAERMIDKQQGIQLIPIENTDKYVAYAPLKEVNWSIALIIPRQNIESQLMPLNLLTLILGSILLIAMIIAWRQMELSEQAKMQVVLLSQQQKTLQNQSEQLEQTLRELQETQIQLVQKEKMSSLGQLVAGVAHEINNPVSFIYGNLTPAREYIQNLIGLLQLYQKHYPNPVAEIENHSTAIELDFLIEDLPKLLTSMQSGANRIKEIVLSLRNFSRLDEAEMKKVNIHDGIDSTLLILEHRLKATTQHPKIAVIREYADLPPIECYPGQMNQVFMNILANAIDALEESMIEHPQIRVQTQSIDTEQVKITITDNGVGIPENIHSQLFNPFFTTKPVGKGTGLGLSISYQIITEKHRGKLQCISFPGEGTEFAMEIPIHQKRADSD